MEFIMPLISEIKKCIETALEQKKKIILFPFGDVGLQVKNIMKEMYDIEPAYILDNQVCKYNSKIKPVSFLGEKQINCKEYALILASTNSSIYHELKQNVLQYMDASQIVEFEEMKIELFGDDIYINSNTKVGKYSYGPLINHWLVESVGAFCSFAPGVQVVENHTIQFVTTHPIMYAGNQANKEYKKPYDKMRDQGWYMEGIVPKGKIQKFRKINIGNDVWLGRNVLITNGANIGNGVIAGAGAVITKDVPDYAVVVGVPARIIRYRYTPEQIAALNRIQWWDWSDDEIRERYDDFYLPIEEFIKKYDK